MLRALALRAMGKDEAKDVLKEGVAKARKQLKINPTDRRALSMASSSLYMTGEHEEAIEWINRALELYPEDAGVLINAACLFALDGNKEKSLSILEHAFRKGVGNLKWISHDPDFDSLKNEPRFIALLNGEKPQPS